MGSLRRPLAVVGFSMLFTVLCFILTDCTALAVFAVAVASMCLIVAVTFRFRTADTLFAIGLGVIIASLLFLNAEYNRSKALTFCGENRLVEAVITDEAEYSEKRNRIYAVASVKSIDYEKVGGKIRLSFPASADGDHAGLKIGDRIRFTGVIYKIGEDSDDIHNSFSAEKIYLGAYSIKIFDATEPKVRPLTYYASLLRSKISYILSESFSDDVSGLINALLTGDKTDCTDSVYRNFKRSGAAHIMAVSGLHLSIWVSLLFFLRRNNEKIRRLRFAVGILIVMVFVFLADFSPSVCRAALMTSLYLLGSRIRKNTDALNTIGFAIICLLCINPFAVFSVSFQLSFACVFSIVVFAVPLSNTLENKLKKSMKNKYLRKAVFYVLSSLIISTSVSAATFPISSYHFGYVSVISPLTNLLVIPACAPLMVSSVLFLIFGQVPFASEVLHITTGILSKYILFVTDELSSLTFSSVCTDMRERLLWLLCLLPIAVCFLLRRFKQKSLLRVVCLLTLFLTLFSLLGIANNRTNECKIKVLNTQSGSAAVLAFNGRGVLLGAAEDYYFSDTLADVADAENLDFVAAVPLTEKDRVQFEYICSDFEIENLLNLGESVELFGCISVKSTEKGAEITVNDKRIGVFSSDYLQVEESYDIIIRNNGIITFADGDEISCEKQGHAMTVYISYKKDIKIRREELWLNLTKKS